MVKEIKNLKKATTRILKAIKKKEKIIIYGDSDMDGVCSVIILKESIKNLGGENLKIYFPDRETEGYGINKKTLEKLRDEAPALFVTLDFSLEVSKELIALKKMGFEIIVIDHHDISNKNPNVDIFVNSKQEGDKYPFKLLANVGIVFRLAKLLFKEKMPDSLRRDFLELAAMATIADMMPRIDENEEIIIEGLSSLKNSWRPGIQALLVLESLKSLTLIQRVIKMNSLLNIRDIKDDLPTSFRLLTISNLEEAGKMVEKLLEKSIIKKRKIKNVVEQVEQRISRNRDNVILEGSSDWELILLGAGASILVKKYQRPVFLYRKDKDESQGSIRAPKGFNLVKAMKNCSKLLIKYGGHPLAAGFTIKNKNIEKFRESLIDYFD